MKRWINVLGCGALLGACFTFALLLDACVGQNARTAADYEAMQMACVDKEPPVTTPAEKRAALEHVHDCRCAVSRQFGRECRWPIADAGLMPVRPPVMVNDVFGSDGGVQ